MKKLLLLLLSLSLTAGILTACRPDSNRPSSEDTSSSITSVEIPNPPDPVDVYYKVTFKQNGQADIVKDVKEGTTLTDVPTPVAKAGYTIVWSVTDFSNITEDITVNAVETAKEYTITYDANGGTVDPATQTVTYNTIPESFATPVYDGYNFICWTYNEKAIQPNSLWTIADNVTLVASWSQVAAEKCKVSFVQDGYEIITKEVNKGGALTDIPQTGDKEGYTVTWDLTDVDLNNVTTDITVNAIETANKYTITYKTEFGVAPDPKEVTYDKTPDSFATLEYAGYVFKGWKYNDNFLSETDLWKIASDIEAVAVWAKLHKVTFKQEGKADIVKEVENGTRLTDIPTIEITKTGYYLSWSITDFSNVTEDITVTVVEQAKGYSLTLNTDGGKLDITTINVLYGQSYTLPKPTKSGYVFKCWKLDGKEIPVSGTWEIDQEDIVLVAEYLQETDEGGVWTPNY